MQKQSWTRNGRSLGQVQPGCWKKGKSKKDVFLKHKKEKESQLWHIDGHLSSPDAELEPKHQIYKGRVVLRGDIVKDDSVAYSVSTEQGSSASQMTDAKVIDVIARLPGCAGHAADAVSAKTQVKMKDAPKLQKLPKSECPDIWIRLPRHKRPKSWSYIEDPVVSLERHLYGHPLAGLLWERQFEEVLLGLGWEKVLNWEFLFVHRKQGLFLSVYVDDIKMAMKIWDALNVNVNRTKTLSINVRISATATEKLPGCEKPHAETVAWSNDMEGHAQKKG